VSGRIARVTVYCSSSRSVDGSYVDTARAFGRLLAESGRGLVYGGGKQGLMGAVSSSVREHGGHVLGVSTVTLRETELVDERNDENIVVETMRERKRLLLERGDAIAVLAGGVGTLEEFFEALAGRLVGEHDKPILLLNTRDAADGTGFYDPLMAMFEHMIGSRFARRDVLELFEVRRTPEEMMVALDAFEAAPRATGDRRRFMPGASLEGGA
jgi:uncharacterized protein (TIGR00730 family)